MSDPSLFWLPLGFQDWLPGDQAVTLGLLTLLQEDRPTAGAPLLASAGHLSWQAGFLGCFLGSWVGDSRLYLLARGAEILNGLERWNSGGLAIVLLIFGFVAAIRLSGNFTRTNLRHRIRAALGDRKSTRLNSSHVEISYA